MAKDKEPTPTKHSTIEPHDRDASLFSIDKIRSGTTGSLATKILMGFLVVVFAVGFLFLNPGMFGGGGGGGGGPQQPVDTSSVVATLGDQSITRGQFLQAEQQQEQMMQQYGMTIGPNELLAMENRTLQSLAGNVALVQAAKSAGIQVTDAEVDAKVNSYIDEQIKSQKGQNPAGFRRQVEARFGSEQGYRNELKKQMQQNRDDIKNALLVEKLQKQVTTGTKSTEETFKLSHTKLHVYQLVINSPATPPNSKDPKTAQADASATAKAEMDKWATQAKANPTLANFVSLVKQHSGDPQTKSKGGDLGWKIPQEFSIDYPMRDALMNANSNIVGPLQDSTTKQYFLFYIAGRKLDLPKDYAAKKADYLKKDQEARASQAWQAFQQKITAQAQTELKVQYPSLQAYALQNGPISSATGKEADDLRKQAVDLYQQGLKTAIGPESAAIRIQLASLYQGLKQPQQAEDVLAAAVKDSPEEPQVLIAYATTLQQNRKTDEAIKQLQAASKVLDLRPSTPSMFGGNPNDALRYQIASEYDALGKKDLADAERKKIKPQKPGGLQMR
ncbi:MAG: SurA N-terminal domain-containing protein [Abditibacteriaceae bacterium]